MAIKDTARLRTRLSSKYPKAARLTKERLEALASKLKVTDDSTDEEVDTELTERNDNGFQTFEEIVIEDDRLATEMTKLKKGKQVETPAGTASATASEEEAETGLTAFEKRVKELEEKLAAKEAKEQMQSLSEKFKTDERLKGVPASWIKNNTPKSEEDFEEAVTGLAKDFEDFALENKLESYGKDTPTASAGGGSGAAHKRVTPATKEETDALASTLLGS